jgi:tRNA(Ile)-lysidine synthetase-like protein
MKAGSETVQTVQSELARGVRDALRSCEVGEGALTVAAVSGGPDSLALALLLAGAGQRVVVAHVDHGLRAESSREAEWVADWSERQGFPCEVARLDGTALASDESGVLAAARRERYAALGAIARRHGARYVATGHHRDDQIETALIRLARGLGPDANLGMPASRPLGKPGQPAEPAELIRPLLHIAKSALFGYLRERGETWLDDPSNRAPQRLRARLREGVLPALASALGEGRMDAMARSITLRSAQQVAQEQSLRSEPSDAPSKMPQPGFWPEVLGALPLPDLAARSRAGLMQRLHEWAQELGVFLSTDALGRVADLVGGDVGKRYEASGVAVWREREHLLALPAPRARAQATIPLRESPLFVGIVGRAETSAREAGARFADLSARRVDAGRCVVRAWERGDRVRFAGSERSVNLARALSRRKVPVSHRAHVVVAEMDGHIVAVPGVGAAHGVAASPDDAVVLRLSMPPIPSY